MAEYALGYVIESVLPVIILSVWHVLSFLMVTDSLFCLPAHNSTSCLFAVVVGIRIVGFFLRIFGRGLYLLLFFMVFGLTLQIYVLDV